MTKGDKKWHLAQGKKCVIYRLDIIFRITHVPKIKLFCQRDIRRYSYRDIGRKIPNFIPCQEVEKWQWLIVSMWHLFEVSEDNASLTDILRDMRCLTETHQISNLKSQDISIEILSDLVRKNVAEFSDKFLRFQYATREMCKGSLNNYSLLKLRFLISIHTFVICCKNVSHQYYASNQDTKPYILS